VPFHAASAVEVLVKQLNDKAVPPRERRPDLNIDPELEALVLKCLAKQRDERVQSMDELLQGLTQIRSHIVGNRGSRTPDPLAGVSPPGLLNPTPPVAGMRARPAAVRGTPAGSVPLASISSRVPHNTPRPISARVPHSIPPTPALVQTGPLVAKKKRGPVIAVGAAVVVAVAVIGGAWYVRAHRAPETVRRAPRAAMVQIELDSRRPEAPAPVPAPAPVEAAPVPVQPAATQAIAETKAPPQVPAAKPAPQKEAAKPAPVVAAPAKSAKLSRKSEPVAPPAKEPEKTVAKASPPPEPAPVPEKKPEPPPAPVIAAASLAGSAPPPTLPISTRPRDVSSALLQTQKLNTPSPKIPEWFQRNFARQTMEAVYRICIGTDGKVSEVKIMTALGGGVDDELVKQIKATWTYRPQLIPLCADSKMVFRL
jgi:outer membrane biosynthesis protein TonB